MIGNPASFGLEFEPRFYSHLELIRTKKPLVHHIINYVAMNDSANVTLSLGASPIMAHAIEELEDVVSQAQAVYINIGTLDSTHADSMLEACRLAEKYSVPVVLDPVGAGATRMRTHTALRLLERKVDVLKGNAGEIAALAGIGEVGVKGVDSILDAKVELALTASEKHGVVAAVTGQVDYVAFGRLWASVAGGTPLFRSITGAGCMAGSAVAAFLSVNSDYFEACVEGLTTFKAAGHMAAKDCPGPGGFRARLLDQLYGFTKDMYGLVKVGFGGQDDT